MEHSFNPTKYLDAVARELILAFDIAGDATTPGLVGAARELPVREKFEKLLPGGIAIGEGCIIDSYGQTSKQQDVVLYERDICPVFSINGTPGTTYYPCEGVIAVGEIKSTIGTREIKDIVDKISSVKKLQRYGVARKGLVISDETVNYRKYGSNTTYEAAKSEEFNQLSKTFDQIFGFALAGEISLKRDTLLRNLSSELEGVQPTEQINCIAILNEGLISPFMMQNNIPTLRMSRLDGDRLFFSNPDIKSFQQLIYRLYLFYRQGRTVDQASFDRYLLPNAPMSTSNALYL